MWLVLLLLPASSPRAWVLDGPAGAYVVIVNSANPVTEVRQDALARLFLKKVRRWDDGRTVVPVDQSVTSPVRARFTKTVLRLSIGEIREYWMRETFSGREVPPVVKASEAEVIDLVRSEAGAVAYVSPGAKLPQTVKTVTVKE